MVLGYEELTDAERAVWEAAKTGRLVDLRVGDAERDDLAKSASWADYRQVRAQLLIEILTGISEPKDRSPRALKLAGARITGVVDLEAVTLLCPLLLRGCYVDLPITLQEGSAPAVRLPGCHIASLNADQLKIRGSMELNEGFTASGEIGLRGAHIGGHLNLNGAVLSNPDGTALMADGLTVDQSMLCRGGFRSEGEIRLVGAKINQQLSFVGATLTNPDGTALMADGLTVEQSMLCHSGFRAEGGIVLRGARIGGQLNLDGATLNNPDGDALNADGLIVDTLLLCREGFNAKGGVRLRGARIGGQLNLDGATLNNPDGDALNLQELHTTSLLLRPNAPPTGKVDFTHAQVDVFLDEEATWPITLTLRGFVYDTLFEQTPISAAARLRWLDRDPEGYAPQPYEQLVAVYRRAGRDHDARKVAIAKQRRRRETLNWPGKLWNSLLRWTVGYGYRTWQAGLWLLGMLAIGAAIFARAYPSDMTLTEKPGNPLPAFQEWVYSLDVLLPVVNLHQEEFWIPQGLARWWAWFSILAGWLLTTLVVAALTGLLKKD